MDHTGVDGVGSGRQFQGRRIESRPVATAGEQVNCELDDREMSPPPCSKTITGLSCQASAQRYSRP